jgi:hypothetical protein
MHHDWHKRGLLIAARGSQAWAQSHAALPVADVLDEHRIDVYYSPRDAHGSAHIARARVRAGDDGELAAVAQEAELVLSPGARGAFDESGVTVSCIAHSEDATYLYYTGWTLGVSVPFYFYVGLAVRPAGEHAFRRVSAAPILERNAVDPYLTASPWVLRENGAWRMWYVSCVDWTMVDGEPRHRYHVRYAESTDGIVWRRDGRVSVDFADESEYAISRPCVVHDPDSYRMWFAARGDRYRLGYAESLDGLTWTRDDSRVGLEPSREGWDAELAYPAILDVGTRRYLLYNGNGYGATGIGYAVVDAAG